MASHGSARSVDSLGEEESSAVGHARGSREGELAQFRNDATILHQAVGKGWSRCELGGLTSAHRELVAMWLSGSESSRRAHGLVSRGDRRVGRADRPAYSRERIQPPSTAID